MIIKLLTNLVTRDVDAFVNFIDHIHDKIDALVLRHAGDIGRIQGFIDEIEEDVTVEVQSINDRLAKEIAALEAAAHEAVADAYAYVDREVTAAKTEIAVISAKVERLKAAAGTIAKI